MTSSGTLAVPKVSTKWIQAWPLLLHKTPRLRIYLPGRRQYILCNITDCITGQRPPLWDPCLKKRRLRGGRIHQGVYYNLAACQAGISFGPAYHKASGRIYQKPGFVIQQLRRYNRFYNLLYHIPFTCSTVNIVTVLGQTTTVCTRTGLSPSYSVTWDFPSGRK